MLDLEVKNILTGTYSNIQIKSELNKGNIIIHPFNEEQLNNCSYDITLGENYFCDNNPHVKYLNPWNQQSINDYWGSSKKAKTCDENTPKDMNLEIGQKYIILFPGQLILAHTQEFIGTLKNATTMLKARSTMGRCGISCCKDAGWGDIGYFNRYTLEIENHLPVPVILIVGQKIGQIVFISCGETDTLYSCKGSYQSSNILSEVMDKWEPNCMLPRAKLI